MQGGFISKSVPFPILSPHGHTQAELFASDQAFTDPVKLFVQPDHYIFRMLYSQGVSLEDLGIGRNTIENTRKVWRLFAANYRLLRGTPSRLWLDYSFQEQFGLNVRLSVDTADLYYDTIQARLAAMEFRPRALYQAFRIEALSTTDSPLDSLEPRQNPCVWMERKDSSNLPS